MSVALPCPNCGADVLFRSAALPARVCDYCQTLLVRSDSGVAVAGKTAALPFDVSPVQIGMKGRADGAGFEVIGRIRWSWTDGAWNEWFLLFDDGSTAWLGEAMGQFMLLRESPMERAPIGILKTIASGGEVIPGHEVQIAKQKLFVGDARDVTCLTSEGELPFVPKPGLKLYSVDLRGRDGECVSVQRDEQGTSLYQGRYVTLAELQPRGLRVMEGWATPAYAA